MVELAERMELLQQQELLILKMVEVVVELQLDLQLIMMVLLVAQGVVLT